MMTNLWKGVSVAEVYSFLLKVVSDVSVDHERKDEIGVAIRSVKAHAEEADNIYMIKSFH